jgi:hypothetical protein
VIPDTLLMYNMAVSFIGGGIEDVVPRENHQAVTSH